MRLAPVLALLLGACSGSGNDARPAEPMVSVEMPSEDAVAGRRPVLTLSCGPSSASFHLALVRAPEAPPQDPHGSIKLDDDGPQRVGLIWLGEDRWAPALDAAAETALAKRMAAARSIYFLGPEGTTERAYRWETSRLEAGLETLRSACR